MELESASVRPSVRPCVYTSVCVSVSYPSKLSNMNISKASGPMGSIAPSFLIGSSSYIHAGNKDNHKISDEFEIWPDRTTAELAALEHLEKIPRLIDDGTIVVAL